MTEILSDAEYRLLNDNEKAKYWAHRYQDVEEERDRLAQANLRLERVLGQIRELAIRA